MGNTTSFWSWFEEELVPGLYDSRLYNGSRQFAVENEAGLITSKIGFTVGLPRIRQMRVIPGGNSFLGGCEGPECQIGLPIYSVESRFHELPSISQTPRYLEPKLGSPGFAFRFP